MRRRNQKVAKWAVMAGLALALGPRAEANTTYTYRGNPFGTLVNTTAGQNPYSTTDFIQVVLTTVNPLPPNLPFPTPLTSGVVSLQMTDGGLGPSVDPLGRVYALIIATDANGAISQWAIGSVTISSANQLQTVFGTTYQNSPQAVGPQVVGLDFAGRCPTTNTACGTTTGPVVAGFSYSAGTWSMSTTQGPQPTVQVTPSPAVLGQPVTVSVTVPGTPTPTGSVQLQVNGNSYGNAIPLLNGAATINIPDSKNGIPDPSLILPVGGTASSVGCQQSQNSVVIQYSGETDVYPRQQPRRLA